MDMNIFSGKKVGVSAEEKALSYFKYYEQDMAEIPKEKLDILTASSVTEIVPFSQRNMFLNGSDREYCQIGYGVAGDGTGFVCNTTYMPKVRGEMLDWWFPWHSVGSDLRYKIWDPEDHYFARADRAGYVCNPTVPVNRKTWGVKHYILEDVGNGPSPLVLQFMSPKDFGYDIALIGCDMCESMVCAIGAGECAAAMTHKWYPYKDGVMLCSRFWIGYRLKDGEIVSALPDGVRIPVEVARGLFAHNIKEFSNLAAILPVLYAENKYCF